MYISNPLQIVMAFHFISMYSRVSYGNVYHSSSEYHAVFNLMWPTYVVIDSVLCYFVMIIFDV